MSCTQDAGVKHPPQPLDLLHLLASGGTEGIAMSPQWKMFLFSPVFCVCHVDPAGLQLEGCVCVICV